VFEHLISVVNSLGTCISSATMFTSWPDGSGQVVLGLHRMGSHSAGTDENRRADLQPDEGLQRPGGLTRKDDDYPARYYEEPVNGGPTKGSVAIREVTDKLLDEYYGIRGWTSKRNSHREKLIDLGLRMSLKKSCELPVKRGGNRSSSYRVGIRMFNKVSHIGIAAKDIEAAIALYEKTGARPLARRTATNGTTALAMLDLEGF